MKNGRQFHNWLQISSESNTANCMGTNWVLDHRRPVHIRPEEFENGEKFHSENARIRCFPSALRRRNLKTSRSRGRRSHMIIVMTPFSKSSGFKLFSENANPVFSNYSSLKKVSKKAYAWSISMDSRPTCRNKVAFSNFPGVMRTMPKYAFTSATNDGTSGSLLKRWMNMFKQQVLLTCFLKQCFRKALFSLCCSG